VKDSHLALSLYAPPSPIPPPGPRPTFSPQSWCPMKPFFDTGSPLSAGFRNATLLPVSGIFPRLRNFFSVTLLLLRYSGTPRHHIAVLFIESFTNLFTPLRVSWRLCFGNYSFFLSSETPIRHLATHSTKCYVPLRFFPYNPCFSLYDFRTLSSGEGAFDAPATPNCPPEIASPLILTCLPPPPITSQFRRSAPRD